MSIVQFYGRSPYDLNYVWPAWVQIPVDGDPFSAFSVQSPELALFQRNLFIYEQKMKANSAPTIKAGCKDGATVEIYPYGAMFLYMPASLFLPEAYYLAVNPNKVSITVADLEPTGTFSANTWYYVYLELLGDGTTKHVIKTDIPHTYLLYKDDAGAQDRTYKYLFSFNTTTTGTINNFERVGRTTMYLDENATNKIIVNATGTTLTTVNVDKVLPPHGRYYIAKVNFYNNDPIVTNSVKIHTTSATDGYIINDSQHPTGDLSGSNMITLRSLASTPATMKYQITDPNGAGSTLNVSVLGFIE